MPCRGPFGMGEENDNSEKLLSFCVSHDLLIGGTWFRHRLVHRYTFNPPDQQMRKKMLDHILFGSRHRSCLHNVRTRRGKITLTDHEMVIAEVRFKVVAHKPRSQPKVCSTKLRDEVTRDAFCAEVKRYLDESDIVEGVEQSWANFRTALNAAATKLLIPEKRVHKPWITVETLALIRKRAGLHLRKHKSAEALLVFSNSCKEVRKASRSDKRQWLKDKGETIQDHSDKGDLKEVFGESKQLCQKWSPHISKLVSTTGETLKTKEERLERWTEHFKHLLNPTTTSGNSVLSIVEASESLEIDLGPIRFDEVLNAVRKLKNGKASGPDDISAEMLKSHIGIAEWLWTLSTSAGLKKVFHKTGSYQKLSRYTKAKEKDLSVGTIGEFHCSRYLEKFLRQSS